MSRREKVLSDGTGREPRPEQQELYNQLINSSAQVVGANAVTGIGKSMLARGIQMQNHPCDIITPDNALVKQYLRTYPELNAVMGKERYDSAEEYKTAHGRAKAGAPSVFNPLSHYYAKERGLRRPSTIVIDEAHLFADMLTFLSAMIIPVTKTGVPENAQNEGDLIRWCYKRYEKLKEAVKLPNVSSLVIQEFEKMATLKGALEEGTQNQVFQINKDVVMLNGRRTKCLVLIPLRIPNALVRAATDADKVYALSGSMTHFDMSVLSAGRSFEFIRGEYLTPPENRPVYFNPVDPDFRKDPEVLAAKIKEIYLSNKVPTLVHVTYGQARLLADLLNELRPMTNRADPVHKAEVVERFKRYGGIWLASGVSEGIDLPYDACRQMIIPTLLYPDRNDLFVQKRVGLADGQEWYDVRTYANTVQRLGRGVRAKDDSCVSHILDPSFARLHDRVGDQFAKMNIIWEKK